MTTRTRFLVLVLTTPLVVFTLVGGLLGQQRTAPGAYPHLRVFDDVVSLIFGSYVEEPNPGTVLDGAMLGLAEGLDPDSSYLDAAQVTLLDGARSAATGSTGLSLTRQYYLRVVAARDGSPAAQAGPPHGRLHPRHRRQVHAAHVAARGRAAPARRRRLQGHAHRAPRQPDRHPRGAAQPRRGPAGRRDAPHRGTRRRSRAGHGVQRPDPGPAEAGRGCTHQAGRDAGAHRPAAHLRRGSGARRRGGSPVREVRNAGHP